MTPDAFCDWLAAMKAVGLASSDADCARLLRVRADQVVRWKTRGGDYRLALACAALLAGLTADA